ncbi:MAG: hypothetical protein H6756_10110 [Candidatus Omnitrophica bacterium]|nr:hypothetical protein [Candidatus Omnitrophota bacterium]
MLTAGTMIGNLEWMQMAIAAALREVSIILDLTPDGVKADFDPAVPGR